MGEALKALGLDPSVLLLQVVAFVILYLLLRRYLFRPLFAVMAQRQAAIKEGLAAGEQAKTELARIDQERARLLAEAREQGREQVRQAVREGEQAREQILAEARVESQEMRERARRALELEREEAALALRRQVVELALLAADKAVLRRLDEETHRRVVDDFIASLEQEQ
jgi:F-type H+-transporting ATPase subunit b